MTDMVVSIFRKILPLHVRTLTRMRGSRFSGGNRQVHRHCIGSDRNGRLFLDPPTGLFAKPVCIMFNYSWL